MAAAPETPTPRRGFYLRHEDYLQYLTGLDLENWDEGGELSRFAYLRTSLVFPVATIPRRGQVAVLPETPSKEIPRYTVHLVDGNEITFDKFVENLAPVDGILIVHQGQIVYERYPRMAPTDKHLLFSVTKAFVGTLVGLLEAQGLIAIRQPVEDYLPEVANTGWAGTQVRDILDMASGIAAPDGDITNPRSEHYRLEASLGWLPLVAELPESVTEGRTYDYLTTLGRASNPGIGYEYSSANTQLLTWIIERVTGRAVYDALFDWLWSRFGAESDAVMVVNRRGIGVGHAGLSMTLRDLARFGLLFTRHSDLVAEQKVIPEILVQKIQQGRPELIRSSKMIPTEFPIGAPGAYQWEHVYPDGGFCKSGYAGQWLYISPASDLVVAYVGSEEFQDTAPSFSAVVRSLLRDQYGAAV